MIEVVIPTRDSARWIGQNYEYYQSIGLEPLYIHDPRSVDETLEILQRHGARVIEFQRTGEWLEDGMVEYLSGKSGFDWILRIDDDEAPSVGLFNWALEHCVDSDVDVWEVSRRELHLENGQIVYTNAPTLFHTTSKPNYLNAQARLYNRNRVEFQRNMHSCGFGFSTRDWVPEAHYLVHFSAIVRSFPERIDKVRTYERIRPGSSWMFLWQYVPELMPDEFNRAAVLEAPEFDDLFKSLPQASTEETVELTLDELRAIKYSPIDADAIAAAILDNQDKQFFELTGRQRRRIGPVKRFYLRYRPALLSLVAIVVLLMVYLFWLQ